MILISLLFGVILSQHTVIKCRKVHNDSRVTIFHTNDFHSQFLPMTVKKKECSSGDKRVCYGGLARMKAKMDDLRKQYPESLLLDAGDQFQGTMFFTYFKGNITAESMNLLKYNAMTIGNHEFDHGSENLARVAKKFNFPLVSSNVNAKNHPDLGPIVKDYHLFEEHKIALVGFLTINATQISNIGTKVTIEDPVQAVQKVINKVKGLGYEKVIAISHNGYQDDIAFAKNITGLSLIIGGHTHSYLATSGPAPKSDLKPESEGFYPTGIINAENKTTYIVQAFFRGRFIGHLDLLFGSDGYIKNIQGAPIELDSSLPEDVETLNLVNSWKAELDIFTQKVISKAANDFGSDTCADNECEIGNLFTDIVRSTLPDINFAFINAAGLRSGFSTGNIAVKDVLNIHPYSDAVVIIELTGEQVNNLVSTVVTKKNPANEREVTSFLQISGMKFSYNSETKEVLSIDIFDHKSQGFLPLDYTKTYKAATLAFISTGGDNLLSPPFSQPITNKPIDSIVIEYLRIHPMISPNLDGRIIKK